MRGHDWWAVARAIRDTCRDTCHGALGWRARRFAPPTGVGERPGTRTPPAVDGAAPPTELTEPLTEPLPPHAAVILGRRVGAGRPHVVMLLATSPTAEEIIEIAYFDGVARPGPDGDVYDRAGVLAVDAFARLQQIAVDRDLRVELYISDKNVRDWFVGAPPHRHLSPTTFSGAQRSGVRVLAEDLLRERAAALAPTGPSVPDRPAPTPLVIATDASQRAGRPGIGIAYVTESGQWQQRYLRSEALIHDGELQAILLALTERREPRITVLTDSRLAVSAITGKRHVESSHTASIVSAIQRQMACRQVTVTWVKGHAGHPLNEVADRLARAARRNACAGIPQATRERIAANIVADLAAAEVA
ncbi:MAG: reverse transcriptase-like protein [Gordonia sp. (in: high G+C Gram-positive bacteria)]